MGRKIKHKEYISHSFYCLNCGQKNVDLYRKKEKLKGKGHKKVLYCPYCRQRLNHLECRNDEEVFEFKRKFQNGDYKQEALESILYVKEREW